MTEPLVLASRYTVIRLVYKLPHGLHYTDHKEKRVGPVGHVHLENVWLKCNILTSKFGRD